MKAAIKAKIDNLLCAVVEFVQTLRTCASFSPRRFK